MPSFPEAAYQYCKWLTAKSGSSFVSSFFFLSAPRRQAMEVIYAFCRAMDDVVDREDTVPEEARKELQRWRRELEACEQGFAAHPIAVAVEEIRRRYDIPMDYFRKLIDGVEMDLEKRRYGTFEELRVYCEHVASVVGLMSVRVFGCKHPEADRYATELGIAFQLTNILRDIQEDAKLGRVYLPAEDLRRFGCAEQELLSGQRSDRMKELIRFQIGRARGHFQRAKEAMRSSGESWKLLPARIMGWVYSGVLRRIERCLATS